jgi:hypothetical protein
LNLEFGITFPKEFNHWKFLTETNAHFSFATGGGDIEEQESKCPFVGLSIPVRQPRGAT